MRTGLVLLFLGVAVAFVGAHPVEVSSQNEAKTTTSTGTLHRERRTIGILRDLFPNFSKENAVAESKIKEVRVKRDAAPEPKAEEPKGVEEEETEDLDTDATGDNEVSDDSDAESSELEEEEEEEDPRNKRFLNFNLGASAGGEAGASAGSGGGSGNFLFDIIRLVAGSGSSPGGEGTHAATEEGKDEAAYGVGVPGPLTRLFVVANKGVASLIQDLILRLAQTSERIVNFKARLITSII